MCYSRTLTNIRSPGATPVLFLLLGGALSVSTSHNILLHALTSEAPNRTATSANLVRAIAATKGIVSATNGTVSAINGTVSAINSTVSATNGVKQAINGTDWLQSPQEHQTAAFIHGIQNALTVPVIAACILLIACLLVSSTMS